MSTITELKTALAAGIQTALGSAIPELQVNRQQNPNPSPPCIDIYQPPEFTEQVSFGPGNRQYTFTVRARTATVDNPAGQDLLDAMSDDGTPESVEVAIWTVTGVKRVVGPSGYGAFRDVGGQAEWLGVTWQVTFIP